MADDHDRAGDLGADLRTVLGLPGVRVEPWRSGVDFFADLVHDGPRLLGVVRSPRVEHLPTSYEGVVDFGEVLAKEAVAVRLLAGSGVPVPRVLLVRRAGSAARVSWSLAEFVESEDDFPVAPVLAELGRLTRAIHGIEPDETGLRPERSWGEFFTTRLSRRLAAAATYMELPVGTGFLERVGAIVGKRDHAATRLLHMDLRPPNLCVRAGRIVGVLDLANCLVGDPLLELARIRSYGLLDDSFLDGYGTACPEDDVEEILLDVYQLDTEALLVSVAVEEIGDQDLHRDKIRTTRELCTRIDGMTR
jgi:aminoglycoside phosphotransferase (APT) family kinase protein